CSDRQWVTSSLIASPKDQVVSSGSHPAPAAPVSDPVRVCCVRAKPCPRRLNDQGLLDSYGVYRSPWISCSFARHLVRKHRNHSGSSPLPCSTSSGAFLQSAVVTDFIMERNF